MHNARVVIDDVIVASTGVASKRDTSMAIRRAVIRAMPGFLMGMSVGPMAALAQGTDDAPVRCFLLHGAAALRACQEVIASNRPAEVRAEAHYNRGIELENLGRPAEALPEFAEAIRLKPDYAAASTNMGVALTRLHRWEDAVGAYRQAIRQSPMYADAHYNLGVALANLRRWEEALSAFREAARLNVKDADARYNIGLVLNILRRHDEALEAYRSAVRARPAYVSAWGDLGMTAYLLGRYRESAEAFETARTLAPDYFDTRPVQREAWDAARHQWPPVRERR